MMLISIIVPIYNIENYIEECVQSIINQSYKDLEIILVDDGSSDNSPLICDELAKKDNRIRVIHKKNGGLSSARNAGIEIAKGEYFGFVDGDDIINKDMYDYLLNIAIKEEADIVQCEYKRFTEKSEIIDENYHNEITIFSNIDAMKNLHKPGINISSIVIWSKIYKRELFEGIIFPKGKIHEDENIAYKLFYKANKLIYTKRELYYYRNTPNSIITSKYNKNRLDVLDALDERFNFISKNINDKELYDLSLEYYMMYCVNSYDLYKENNPNDKETLKGVQKRVKEKLNLINDCNLIGLKRNIRIRLFVLSPTLMNIIKKFDDLFEKKN